MLMPVPHHALLVLRLSSSIASFSWSIFLCSEERRKELKLKAELVKTARTHSNHRKKRKNCWLILLGACRMHSAVLIWGLIPYTVIKPKKSQLLFMCWKSQMQTEIALSSTESEYTGLTQLTNSDRIFPVINLTSSDLTMGRRWEFAQLRCCASGYVSNRPKLFRFYSSIKKRTKKRILKIHHNSTHKLSYVSHYSFYTAYYRHEDVCLFHRK